MIPFASGVSSLARDDSCLAAGLACGRIDLREIGSGERVREWRGHRDAVSCLLFVASSSSSGSHLVSGSYDQHVKKWDARTGAQLWARNATVGTVYCMSELGEDGGGRLVVGGDDGSVRVLDGATGHEVMAPRRGHDGPLYAVASLGAGSFASGSADSTIQVWAGGGGAPVRTLARAVEIKGMVFSLRLSPCGRRVAAGFHAGLVSLYSLPGWDLVWSVKAHADAVRAVAWSPDGRFLATGSLDLAAKVLSADTGATLRTLWGHARPVAAVVFTRDGTKVLTGSADATARVWRVFGGAERRVRAMMGAVEAAQDPESGEVCCEVVARMKRLWDVERN